VPSSNRLRVILTELGATDGKWTYPRRINGILTVVGSTAFDSNMLYLGSDGGNVLIE
jgi:hypothetical protein